MCGTERENLISICCDAWHSSVTLLEMLGLEPDYLLFNLVEGAEDLVVIILFRCCKSGEYFAYLALSSIQYDIYTPVVFVMAGITEDRCGGKLLSLVKVTLWLLFSLLS